MKILLISRQEVVLTDHKTTKHFSDVVIAAVIITLLDFILLLPLFLIIINKPVAQLNCCKRKTLLTNLQITSKN